MTYSDNLWLFFLLVAGIVIVPGMDMLFVLASALAGGRRSGFAATGGTIAGGAVHTLYGTLGAGLLVTFAPSLFKPLLMAGAAYMAWIGVTLARSSITVGSVEPGRRRSDWRLFRQGAMTCLINPKAYIFVMAVYPQFLKPAYGPIWMQGLAIGAITALVQGCIYGGVALAGHGVRTTLTGSPQLTIWLGRGAGLLLIAVAALTLWEGTR